MLNDLVTSWCRCLSRTPCFRIYGKSLRESEWRIIDIHAVERRNMDSRLPFWGGTCTTWSDRIIAVGWDFAEGVLHEQEVVLASRQHPVAVRGGRIGLSAPRVAAGAPSYPTASEILAHECGHTYQALRMGFTYLPVVGAVTPFREGPRWWNRFENEASEEGLFGGIVNGSVCARLM